MQLINYKKNALDMRTDHQEDTGMYPSAACVEQEAAEKETLGKAKEKMMVGN